MTMVNKKYYLAMGDFANTYRLCYVADSRDQRALERMQNNGTQWERTTRAIAINMAWHEHDRRVNDQCMSGYADDRIRPAHVLLDSVNPWMDTEYIDHNGRFHKEGEH